MKILHQVLLFIFMIGAQASARSDLSSDLSGEALAKTDPISVLEICDTVYFFLETIPPAQHAEFAAAMTTFYLNNSDLSGLEFITALHHQIPAVATTLQQLLLATPTGLGYADIMVRDIRRKLRANPAWYAHGLMLTAAQIWYQKNYRDDRFPLEIFAEVWIESTERFDQPQSWLQRVCDAALEFLDAYKFLFLAAGVGGFLWLSHPRH